MLSPLSFVIESLHYFKKSNIATLTLRKEKTDRNPDVEPLQLIQEVPTRWNSVYYMIKRILKLIDSITAAQRKLPQAPDIISPEEENNSDFTRRI